MRLLSVALGVIINSRTGNPNQSKQQSCRLHGQTGGFASLPLNGAQRYPRKTQPSGLVEPQRCQLQSNKKTWRTFAKQLLIKINALSPPFWLDKGCRQLRQSLQPRSGFLPEPPTDMSSRMCAVVGVMFLRTHFVKKSEASGMTNLLSDQDQDALAWPSGPSPTIRARFSQYSA